MPIFNIHEAKTKLSQLIARAEAGEEIVIARDGDPIVRLDVVRRDVMAERRRRAFGMLKGQLGDIPDSVWFDPLTDEEAGYANPTDEIFFGPPKKPKT